MTTYGTIPTSSSPTTNLEFLSRAKERLKTGLGTRQPWKQMFDYHSFTLPPTSHVITRIKTNLSYFRMNYAIIVLVILFLSLLWHPISMIVFIVMMVLWLFLYFLRDEPLALFGKVIDDRIVLGVLAVLTLGFLFLTGVAWNILGSLLIGAVFVIIHAAVRDTADLDEAGPLYSGIPSSSSA